MTDKDAASVAAVFDGEHWVEADPAARSDWRPEAQAVADNAAKIEQYDPNPDLPPLPDKTPEEQAADRALVNRDEDLAHLLDDTMAFLLRFVVFASPAQVVAVTLWVGHTWWKDRLETTPYLAILSAAMRCGKSRLLDVLELLVCHPWRVTFPTAAVLFRKIDKDQPTLLLDEVDAIFGRKANPAEDLRGIFNDGHRVGGTVPRLQAKGKSWEIEEFGTFCPKAFAGIGRALPDTVTDRAIIIRLRRKAPTEPVEKFRLRTVKPQSVPLREQWAAFSSRYDLNPDPYVPPQLNDRAADGWEPLLAVADLAGGEWPQRSRAAAVYLAADATADDDSLGIRLLSDIARVFTQDRLSTHHLLEALHELEDAPWGELFGRPLSPHGLSKLLRPFDIHPTKIRFADSTLQGYRLEDFSDAFTRYTANQTGTSEQASNYLPENRNTESSQNANRNKFKPASNSDVPMFRSEGGEAPNDGLAGGNYPFTGERP